MAFQYRARDPDAWEKRATQQGGDFQGIIIDEVKTYNPKKGDNYIRILPPTWDDAEHYGLDIWVHYGIGPDRASVLCLRKMKNEPCPLCEALTRAEKSGDEELAKELQPSKRVLVWIIDRNDEQQGPLAWSMPWTLDREFCKISRDKRTGAVYAIDDPEGGYDISFEKEGEQITTKYTGVQLSRRTTSVDEAHLDFVQTLPLPDVLLWRSYDDVRVLFEGSGMERAPQAAAPAAPARRTPPPASAAPARRAPPPPPDDEYADPLPPEDPPPPAPRRPGGAAGGAAAAPPPAPSGASRAADIRAKLAARAQK